MISACCGILFVHGMLVCAGCCRKHPGGDQSRRQDLQHCHYPSPFKCKERCCSMKEVRTPVAEPNARLAHAISSRGEPLAMVLSRPRWRWTADGGTFMMSDKRKETHCPIATVRRH